MDIMDMDMVTVPTGTDTPPHTATDTTVTTARGLLMLSPDMVTTAMDTATTDTMARGPLMLSPDMVTTAMDTEDTTEGMDTTDTAMVTATATTDEALAPESPWWLVRKGRTEDAKKAL